MRREGGGLKSARNNPRRPAAKPSASTKSLRKGFAACTGFRCRRRCLARPVQPHPKVPSCSLQRALLTPKVNLGSLYHCGESA